MLQRIKTKEHPIDLVSYSSSWRKKTTFTKQTIGLRWPVITLSNWWFNIYTCKRSSVEHSRLVYTLICKIKALFKTSGTHFRKRTVASEQHMLTCRVFWETWGLFLMHRKPEGSVRWSCVDSRFMPKPFSMAEIPHFSLLSESAHVDCWRMFVWRVHAVIWMYPGFHSKHNVNLHCI